MFSGIRYCCRSTNTVDQNAHRVKSKRSTLNNGSHVRTPSEIVKKLNDGNGISSGDLKILLSADENTKNQVTTIRLNFKPSREDLAVLDRFSNLVNLNLSNLGLGNDIHVTLLPDILPNTIKSIDLSNNRLGPAEAKHLSREYVLPSGMTNLNLYGNSINNIGAEHLLTKNGVVSKLKVCNLGNNHINAGASHLFTWDVFSREMEELNLEKNPIGDEGIVALMKRGYISGSVLPPELKRLNLNDCGITAKGMSAYKKSEIPELQDLTLSHNKIGTEGVKSILDLKSTMSLRHLNLAYCGIDSRCVKDLKEKAPEFENLKSLNLYRNKMGTEAFDLEKAFSPGRKVEVNVDGNRLVETNPYGLNTEDPLYSFTTVKFY